MGVNVTVRQLEIMCKDLMKTLWNEEFDLPIEISGRMSSTMGYFMTTRSRFSKKWEATLIKFSKQLVSGSYNIETIESVVKHELCHYHIFRIGGNYNDGSFEFESEIKRIGASSTHTISHAGEMHKGICSKCGRVVIKSTERRVKNKCNNRKYTSRCCGATIKYNGYDYLEDNNKLSPVTSTLAQKISDQINEKVAIALVADPIPEIINIPKKENTLNIDDIVKPGKRGMTGEILYHVVKNLIDNHEGEKLKLINEHYNKTFLQVRKYWKGKRIEYLEQIGL